MAQQVQLGHSAYSREAQRLVLAGPFGWQVGEAGNSHPMREPPSDALTRSGARKASEIVIFTLRTLHRSRLAMLSEVAVCSATIDRHRPFETKVFRTQRPGVLRRRSIRHKKSFHGAALILSSARET